jgi:Xaa-Pro aminopeptidase
MIEKSEYRARIARFASLLRTNDMAGALLTAESNIDYYTGFRHHAPWTLFARPFFQIVSADGRTALLTHSFLAPEMQRTSAVDDVRIFTHSGAAPVDQIREIMAEFGMNRGSLGMELGYEQRLGISLADFRSLEKALPAMTLVDAADCIWKLRMIKSPAEIAMMRRSADATRAAFEAGFAAAKPGVTEREVGQACARAMIEHGAERPGFILSTSGEGNYHILSGKPTDRKLVAGDLLWLDMGAVVDGYWSDFCRTAYLGRLPPALKAGQDMIINVNEAMLDAAKPGRTLRDIARAAEKAFAEQGQDVSLGSGRIGHGMGLMSTEPPHVALYDETVCEEGLVFTIEPRVTTEQGVFECEEILAITANGVDILTTSPRGIVSIS